MDYKVVSLKDRYDLFKEQDAVCEEVWPEFMLHDPVANEYWMQFVELFKDYQILIMDGDNILAVANTVPIFFDKQLEELPEEGWDWGVKKSVEDYKSGINPNILMGVQIVVNRKYHGKGLSSIAVKEMAALAERKGFSKLIIPVRPSDKHKYPLISMDDYILWNNEKGYPFDNWLRVHIKCGASIIKVCHQAMKIPGTIPEWRKWTELDFPGSGEYVIPGALNPVLADISRDEVVYIEPNVWILHKLLE